MKPILVLFFAVFLAFSLASSLAGQDTSSDCANVPTPQLIVGEHGLVTPGEDNNMRDEPSRDSPLITIIPGEGIFEVWEGPICADGFNWWRVQYNGIVGWTVEGLEEEYWLLPYSTPPTTTPAPTAIFELETVEYHQIVFAYDSVLASSIVAETIPETASGLYDEPYPAYFQFSFISYPDKHEFLEPELLIYPADGLERNPRYFDDIDIIRQHLINRPTELIERETPIIPVFNAAQMIRMQIRYIDFENGAGIRFLTMYSQDLLPVTNDNIFYTFQGLTSDGRYYISATFPISIEALEQIDSLSHYKQEQNDEYVSYLESVEQLLEAQPAMAFTPSLEMLDSLMASLQILDSTADTNYRDENSLPFTPTPSITLTPTPAG